MRTCDRNLSGAAQKLWMGIVIALGVVAAAGQASLADDEADGGPGRTLSEAEQVWRRVLNRYRELKYYECETTNAEQYGWQEQGEVVPDWTNESTEHLRFAAPDRFFLDQGWGHSYQDGRRRWIVHPDEHIYFVPSNEKSPSRSGPFMYFREFSAMWLLSAARGECNGLTGTFKRPAGVESREVNGRIVQVILFEAGEDLRQEFRDYPVEVFVNPDNGLVDRIHVGAAAQAKGDPRGGEVSLSRLMAGEEPVYEIVAVGSDTVFSHVKVNAPLPDEAFRFDPGMRYTMILGYEWEGVRAQQLENLQEEAPAVTWRGSEGDQSLADVVGRVVVVHFWSLENPRSIKALAWLQAVRDRYGDDRVVVLGVNVDSLARLREVREVLEEEKITFSRVTDADGKLAEAYHIAGVPSTVFVDKEGRIADALLGQEVVDAGALGEKVDALLRGQSIVTPELLADRFDVLGVERETTRPEARRSFTLAAEQYRPESLVETDKKLMPSGHYGDPDIVDLGGDGRPEVLLQSDSDRLYILNETGDGVERLKLPDEGVVRKLVPFGDPGRLSWFSLHAQEPVREKNAVTAVLSDAEGKAAWRVELDLPSKDFWVLKAGVGDLNGDGVMEFTVLAEESRSRKVLIVLDGNGQMIAKKQMPKDYEYVGISGPDERGRQGILWIADGELRRMTVK